MVEPGDIITVHIGSGLNKKSHHWLFFMVLACNSAFGQALSGGVAGGNVGAPGSSGEVEITLSANTTPSMEYPINDPSAVLVNIALKNLSDETFYFVRSDLFVGGFPICEVAGNGNATIINGPRMASVSSSRGPLKPKEEYQCESVWPLSVLPPANKRVLVQVGFRRADGSAFTASSNPVLVGDLLPKKPGAGGGGGGKTP